MATVFLQHCREVREDDAVCYTEEQEITAQEMASDALGELLRYMKPNEDTKAFVVKAYAALWAIDPTAFGGKTQREVAIQINVDPSWFNRTLSDWAYKFGFISSNMRPRKSRIANPQRNALKVRKKQAQRKQLMLKLFQYPPLKNLGSSKEVSQ